MTIAFPPLADHLLAAWPTDANRKLVVDGYASLGMTPLLLADIALQGRVFAENTAAANDFESAILEGRRQMALRIIKAAKVDPVLLFDSIERRKPKGHVA